MEQLIAIPSLDLRQDSVLPFDLFVRLPVTNRVILYRREGSNLDQEKFDKVSLRQLNFFVARERYDAYLEYAAREVIDMIAFRPVDEARLREAAGRILSNAFSQEAPQHARELVHNLGDLLTRFVSEASSEGFVSRQTLFLKFARLAQTGTDFQRHPLHVSSLTVMLAIGLGIHDQRTLVEVGLAALMHDVGLTQLPVSVIGEAHKFRELGTVSKALLKLHPQGSLDLLRNRGITVSKLMECMILQHHEEFGGTGYPQGLVGEAVHPFAQVLHVADDLDDLVSGVGGADNIESKVRSLFDRYEREHTLDPALCKRLRQLLLG